MIPCSIPPHGFDIVFALCRYILPNISCTLKSILPLSILQSLSTSPQNMLRRYSSSILTFTHVCLFVLFTPLIQENILYETHSRNILTTLFFISAYVLTCMYTLTFILFIYFYFIAITIIDVLTHVFPDFHMLSKILIHFAHISHLFNLLLYMAFNVTSTFTDPFHISLIHFLEE